MSTAFRVAVIGRSGAGGYGHQLDRGFAAHPLARIVAVADSDATGARDAQERLSASRAYDDHRAMLAAERPDVVVVAPRHTDAHFALVRDALEAGAHVYCEKPFTVDLEEADALLAAADERGLRVGVALPFVHEPRFEQVRAVVARLGRIVSMRAICKCDHRGGGEDFGILGPHFADMMRRFAGDARAVQAWVFANGRAAGDDDVVFGGEGLGPIAGDAIVAAYEFGGGVIGTIESHRLGIESRDEHPYRLEIYGERGAIAVRAPYADHSVYVCDRPFGGTRAPWRPLETTAVTPYAEYHRLAADDFFRALVERRDPACSGRDGRAALEMILGAYAAARVQDRVALPLAVRAHPLSRAAASAA